MSDMDYHPLVVDKQLEEAKQTMMRSLRVMYEGDYIEMFAPKVLIFLADMQVSFLLPITHSSFLSQLLQTSYRSDANNLFRHNSATIASRKTSPYSSTT